jgi:predicted aspartyl protease
MKSIPLLSSGAAYMFVGISAYNGVDMPTFRFLVDTGATRTTIPKNILIDTLGYSEEYIENRKIILPEKDKPCLADGSRANVYKIPAPRINISGHELQTDYILTSDTINTLHYLLGLDILRYFKIIFDFDAVDDDAPYGRMFYMFRESQITPFTKMGDHFAYKVGD